MKQLLALFLAALALSFTACSAPSSQGASTPEAASPSSGASSSAGESSASSAEEEGYTLMLLAREGPSGSRDRTIMGEEQQQVLDQLDALPAGEEGEIAGNTFALLLSRPGGELNLYILPADPEGETFPILCDSYWSESTWLEGNQEFLALLNSLVPPLEAAAMEPLPAEPYLWVSRSDDDEKVAQATGDPQAVQQVQSYVEELVPLEEEVTAPDGASVLSLTLYQNGEELHYLFLDSGTEEGNYVQGVVDGASGGWYLADPAAYGYLDGLVPALS